MPIPVKKLNDYTKLTSVADDDVFQFVHNDVTYNVTAKTIMSYIKDHTDMESHYADETELQNGLDTKLNVVLKGANNGLAELDTNGKVPSSQLPSYVDDVLEGTATGVVINTTTNIPTATGFILSGETTECTPEDGKIYIDTTTNNQYRWSGTIFVTTGSSLALGETSASAYRGDRGKTAYEHSQKTGNAHGLTLTDLGIPNVENKSSSQIRGELTADDVTSALGFVPGEGGGTYGIATDTNAGLVKSGTDITVDSNGNVSVNDDSHNHTDKVGLVTGTSYTTFTAFWAAIQNKACNCGCMFRVRDTGGWCSLNNWVQGFAVFQNSSGGTSDIGGTIIAFLSGSSMLRGVVSGTTTPVVTWYRVSNTQTATQTTVSSSEPSGQSTNDEWLMPC